MKRKPPNEKLASLGLTWQKILIGLVTFVVGIPLLFYLGFGEVGPIGWGLAVVFGVFYLILSLTMYFGDTPAYHEAITCGPAWLTPVGIIWLISCVLGPFFGYLITDFPLWAPTATSWQWQYGLRVLLSIILPLASACPLLAHFLRSRARWVAAPVIFIVTLLPSLTGVNYLLDLTGGAVPLTCHRVENGSAAECACGEITLGCEDMPGPDSQVLLLPHTQRVLESPTGQKSHVPGDVDQRDKVRPFEHIQLGCASAMVVDCRHE